MLKLRHQTLSSRNYGAFKKNKKSRGVVSFFFFTTYIYFCANYSFIIGYKIAKFREQYSLRYFKTCILMSQNLYSVFLIDNTQQDGRKHSKIEC